MKGTLTISAGEHGIAIEASLMFTNDWKDQRVINEVIDDLLDYEPKAEDKEEEAT